MDFGIAAEGVTDQVTIQNILCGIFNEIEDLEQEITFVQPHQDATDEDDIRGYGSWTSLFSYLESRRFREDVLNTEYLIIQIDSDVCEEVGFDVKRFDENNKELTIEKLVDAIIARLISQIGKGDPNFYVSFEDKIIFGVCVDSLECWLYKHYEPDTRKVKHQKTKSCATSLEQVISRHHKKLSASKCSKEYEKLSKPFRKIKIINQVASVDSSLNIFVDSLRNIEYP
ncbi:hypothetical protein EXZ60_18800 [Vibrio sp. 1151_11]|uniref:hypothetical protein n=1 Tax=Vibrio sp. 1151_11 TaxID=2527670 RepID=UPI002405576F|nr:hypothetical protein [Vibrio sp. 1151_11]MDF9390794.1 hypothetical protein [Vibrio sp. 1151_11]